MKMKCPYCNSDIPEGSKKCSNCTAPQEEKKNNYNYVETKNTINKKKKKHIIKSIIIFIFFVVAIVSLFISVSSILEDNKKLNNETNNNQEEQDNNEDLSLADRYVGSESLGYILIPGNWIKLNEYGSYAYGDKDGLNIVSLMSSKTTNGDISSESSKYKKTFEEKEYANIALYLMKINDYSAIQLSGYDQNNQASIYAWFINTGDNPVKIIMMTLKDDVNNYMFIPDSYKLEK